MKILIGTQNKAKQGDFARIIKKYSKHYSVGIELVFPQDVGMTDDVEETGKTFSDNSELKARYYFEFSGIPTISDDGGILIPILGENIPGVHSKRWAGNNASDTDIINFTLKKLEPYKNNIERKTIFKTILSYYNGKKLIQADGETEGHIALKPLAKNATKGFPYRQLFVMPNGKYYDELSPSEHDTYNHRDQAVRRLFSKIFP